MTTFDVIGAVELTMSAAIMVAALSVVMGRNVAERIKVAAVLSGWFVIVVILATTGALHPQRGIGAPGLGLAVALPILLMWVALMRVPSLRDGLDRAPLEVLVGVHVVRILGFSFLVLQARGRLPAPFAPSAGWGDIVAGLAAVPVAWMVYRQVSGWRAALIAWNVFGMADLIAAVTLGVLSSPGPLRRIFAEPGTGLMTLLPWLLIPGFLVPLLFTTHLAIFYRLAKSPRARTSIDAPNGRPANPAVG
ncbi:MAG: hypothetical protein JWL69_1691 [Phycisphaerales bacterium]|nr:hypothetical protein [Phycisphaerales bacterium]MDB5357866.1 hypothetical protein [Phycisphaerales bacterium]